MPLLRKQPFHKQKPPLDIRPEEEVFHCKITNEIFRDYEAFFERIILCNSLVWSCAITGRSGMTYQEAVECEDKAKRHLATFQESLQRPLLFVATLTHRSRLVDLNDDVFMFAKDRYFIGETVDVSLPGETKRPAKILKVIPAGSGDPKTNGDVVIVEDSDSEEEKKEPVNPHKINYLVQLTGSKAPVTVTTQQVHRKKGLYTRDKSKLFLKQYCEPVDGLWKVREDKQRKMGLKAAKFQDFFVGAAPVFTMSVIKKKQNFKKYSEPSGSTSTGKTPDRANTSLPHSCTSSPLDAAVPSPPGSSSLTPKERAAQKEQIKQDKLAEKMAKKEEIKRRIEEEKMKKKEEREKEREKKREERKKQIEKLKEWSRPREDMDCDDLKPLPELSAVKTPLPPSVFGDALMILEYVNAFKSVFDFKQFFPKGFSWAQLESALLTSDPQGPLCDLIQMLLCALFNLQEEEAEEYQELEKEEVDQISAAVANPGEEEEEEDNISNNELLRSATLTAQFSQQTFGMPLRDTLLDQFTLTEVLRLHLMSSGARANSKNARFRYQQRGGYTSLDDPGLELRKQQPGLLRKLNNNNVFDLQPEEKVRLVMTLVQQVMTYAAVRDIVDESFDRLRVKKYDLKLLQWAEVRREREEAAAKYKRLVEDRVKEQKKRLIQAAKTVSGERSDMPMPMIEDDEPMETPEERKKRQEKEKVEEARKKADYAKRELDMLQQIQELARTNSLYPVGRDRMYRRYWLLGAVPAILVEDHELFLSGVQATAPVSEESGDLMPTLIRQDDHNTSSDKENEVSGSAVTNDSGDSGNVSNSGSAETGDCIVISDEEAEGAAAKAKVAGMETDEPPKLDSHPAHQGGSQLQEPRWYLVDSRSCLEQLMDALNPRGFRESILQTALQEMRPLLNVTIDSCPLEAVKPAPEGEEEEQSEQSQLPKPQMHTRASAPRIVEGTTQGDSASEAIELTLRDALLDLDDRIFVGSLGSLKVKDRAAWRAALENGSYSPQTDDPLFAQLEPTDNSVGNVSVSEEVVARHMSHALVQIARGVEPRFLRSPLGEELDESKRKAQDEGKRRLYDRWEESVLATTSLSQVFLHLAAFDKSVKWDRSALMARCRICRRKGDAEKMLLCDGCDRGHHMYCLKPPMTKVPSGDWFCSNCQPKQSQSSPRKNRRRTFSEVSDEEEAEESLKLQETMEEASEEDEEEEAEESEEETMMEDDDDEEEEENEDVCAECRQDGKLILCDVCPRSYHLHCARPPLKKVPRGKWMCQVCVGGNRAGKIQFGRPKASSSLREKKESKLVTPTNKPGKSGSRPGSRRETPRSSPTPSSSRVKKQEKSASKEFTPRLKGHGSREVTPKQKGQNDRDSGTPRSWNAEKDLPGKLKRSSSSTSRLSQDSSDFETSARHYTSSTRGNTTVQQMKLCEDLLQELIRHQEAWPFLKPVDKKLVPDYYDVIRNPMDLSTIRNKVHKFGYEAPVQLLDDVRLIFTNCIEYNTRNTPEYKAGQTLARYFQGRLRDLGIQDESNTPPPPAKKQRR